MLGSPASPCHAHAVPEGRERIQGGSDIQVDGDIIFLSWFTSIVVNDVAHVSTTPVHHPVVSVKRQLITAGDKAQQLLG